MNEEERARFERDLADLRARKWPEDVCRRMIAHPPSNFAHWDWIESEELEQYLVRFQQTRERFRNHVWFNENWANCHKAYDYATTVLPSIYEPIEASPLPQDWAPGFEPYHGPEQLTTTPLKEAIRKGRAVRTNQGFLDGEKEALGKILASTRKLLDDRPTG